MCACLWTAFALYSPRLATPVPRLSLQPSAPWPCGLRPAHLIYRGCGCPLPAPGGPPLYMGLAIAPTIPRAVTLLPPVPPPLRPHNVARLQYTTSSQPDQPPSDGAHAYDGDGAAVSPYLSPYHLTTLPSGPAARPCRLFEEGAPKFLTRSAEGPVSC